MSPDVPPVGNSPRKKRRLIGIKAAIGLTAVGLATNVALAYHSFLQDRADRVR